MKTPSRNVLLIVSVVILAGVVGVLIFQRGRVQQQESLRIAFVGPLTGDDADEGNALLRGISMYLDLINKQGGLQGRKILVDPFDDQNERSRARQRALKIAEQNQAVAVIGHASGESSLSGGRVYKQYKIPALNPVAQDAEVTQENDWYFSLMYTAEMEARFLAMYIKDVLEAPRVNLIYDDQVYGTMFPSVFTEAFQAAGGQIQQTWTVRKRSANMDDVFQKIVAEFQQQTEISAIVVALQPEEGVDLLRIIKQRNLSAPVVASGTLASRQFQRQLANYVEERATPGYYTDGIYVTTPLIFESAGAEARRFHDAYRNLYGESPPWQAAFGYDAARVIVEALRYHAITGAPETIQTDRQKIRDFLLGLNAPERAVAGSTGLTYFTPQRHAPRPMSVGLYQQGRLLPAFVQLSASGNLSQKEAVRIEEQELQKTYVAYSGAFITAVHELDVGELTFRAEGDVWFRSQGDLPVEQIEFLNAVEPVTFDPPLQPPNSETAETAAFNDETPHTSDIAYQLYHFNGLFKMDFQYQHRLLGHHVLRVSFAHQHLPLNQLVYVVDEGGMGMTPGTPFFEELTQSLTRDVQPGWLVEGFESSQALAEQHSKGDPLYAALPEKTISYAQLNFGVAIKKEQVALRNSMPFSIAQTLTWFSGILLILIQIIRYIKKFFSPTSDVERKRDAASTECRETDYPQPAQPWYHRLFAAIPLSVLWFVQIPVGVLLVFAAEPFLIGWLGGKVSTTVLEFFVLGFDLLWWIVPAVIIVSGVERLIWAPLEKKTERIIPNLMRGMVAVIIYLLAFFGIVAFVFHRELTGLLATSGVLAMIIGLAVQLNIANIFSGIAINIERPFRIGDWVKIGEYPDGQVVDITWRTTRLMMREQGNIMSIPNNMASESVVVNYNYPEDSYALEFEVQIVPVHPPTMVRRILLEAVLAVKEVLRDPEPAIDFGGQGDSCGIYYVWFCVKDYELCDDYLTLVWESVWTHLERAGIELATPCRFMYEFEGSPVNQNNRFTPLAMLQANPLFLPFSEEAKIALSQRLRSYHVPPETTIIREGERGDVLLLLAEGVVGIWRTSEAGQAEEVSRGLSGAILGDAAFLTGQPYVETIVTLTEAVFYEITRDEFAPFLKSQPDIIIHLGKVLTAHERQLPSAQAMSKVVDDERQRQYHEYVEQIRKVMGVSMEEGGTSE